MIRRTSLFPKSSGEGKEEALLGWEREECSLCGIHKVTAGWRVGRDGLHYMYKYSDESQPPKCSW